MSASMYIIYKISNSINNKLYIGQTSDGLKARWNGHKTSTNNGCTYTIHQAMRKHGVDKFKIEIIHEVPMNFLVEELDNELDHWEIHFIAKYDSFHNGYNDTLGGGGTRGFKHSQEFKDSQSVRQKNDPNNAFKRTGKDHHNFGKDMSGANNAMCGVTGEAHPLFGVPRTEEAKQAIRDGWAASDYVRTPEHAKAIGDANKGRERPQSEKDQISESLTGLERVRVSCVKCQGECSIGHLKRYHIDAKVCGKENKEREPQKKVKCPHCPKEGGEANMKSFHFDNCLKNPNLTKEEVEALKQERRDRRKVKA